MSMLYHSMIASAVRHCNAMQIHRMGIPSALKGLLLSAGAGQCICWPYTMRGIYGCHVQALGRACWQRWAMRARALAWGESSRAGQSPSLPLCVPSSWASGPASRRACPEPRLLLTFRCGHTAPLAEHISSSLPHQMRPILIE